MGVKALSLLALLLTACAGGGAGADASDGAPGADADEPLCVLAPGAACDPLAPACPAGQGCYLDAAAGALCAPAGEGALNTACTFQNSCQAGLACLDAGEGPRCALPCARDERCLLASCRARCPETYGLLPDLPGAGFCTEERAEGPCDLLKGDCPRGTICTYGGGGPACRKPAGDRARGEACAYANACREGLVCVNGACRSVCDVASPQCPGGGACVTLPGAEPAGVCL